MRYIWAIILLLPACGFPSKASISVPSVKSSASAVMEKSTNVSLSITVVATEQATEIPPIVTEFSSPITSSEVDVVDILEERVAKTPVIVVANVTGVGEIINTTRNVNDPTQPDPHMFGLGQVYHIKVERYLKGDGPASLNVVQAEGDVIYNPNGPPTIPTTSEEVAQLKSRYPHVPLRANTRYLFFLAPMEGFDPALNYRAGGLSEPWRFTLPVTGNAQAESAVHEAVEYFPPLPSTELLNQVEQYIQTQ